MEKHQDDLTNGKAMTRFTSMRGLVWGLIAGLSGTLAMDLALAAGLPALDLPIGTCYLTIGRTAAKFFSILGFRLPADIMLGVIVYHVLGPLLGAAYALMVSRVTVLQSTNLKKNLVYALLYAEVVSQLILTMIPVLLKIDASEALLWFAGSSVLHAIWGMVLGFGMYYWLPHGRRTRPALLYTTE